MLLPRQFGVFSFISLLFVGSSAVGAATADEFVKKGLEAERQMNLPAALKLFQEAAALKPDDPFILQRISRQYSDSTVNEALPEKRRELSERALVFSQRAYALDPKNPVNVLSMAICYGKLGLYGDTKARVENARLIRKYADEALALNPNYDWAHHVLGRWHYEVTELGGAKRFFVSMLYGGLPKASYAEAILHLQKAVSLAPGVVAHHIELGFAFRAAGRTDEARTEFARGLALPNLEIHDESSKRRATEALRTLAP